MSDTVFTKVDYDVNALAKFIELGEIGLPDIQRPFVWKNAKVRDLFDSMYRGYPVGYLLLWKTETGSSDGRTIGAESKQKPPRLVIVDGQQRLTSLYAVIKGVPVLRASYASEPIRVAFNPLEERFEVADAATLRDKAFIPDISTVWSKGTFKAINQYVDGLRATREVGDDEQERIVSAIEKLGSLLTFPFTALELAADVSEKDVADVFVRINSAGTPLNQANFILTLMSVFWDEGRAELEQFCREARKPAKDKPSPFNHFIEPAPDQMLRVSVGVGFRRARLQYVYSILRGKDLATGQFSDDRREAQFEILKAAQSKALNIQYWHDFLNCIRMAGFRSRKMLSSNNTLLYSYIMYLIGRTEYRVKESTLRRAIARWFFMAAVTGRFTSSPETQMDFDLAQLRDVADGDHFVSQLQRVCEVALTHDFWEVTLPNDLATASSRSPSLFAYNAALVLLDAPVLFSTTRVAEQLDPAIYAPKAMIERHHLFPKGHLKTLGLSGTRDTNQIANYAYVEWAENVAISDHPPADYLPQLKLKQSFSAAELARMYHYHALPMDWEVMEYRSFLRERREMMAKIVHEGYRKLVDGTRPEPAPAVLDLTKLIEQGESDAVEFKSTLRTNLHTGDQDKRMEQAVLKTVGGFLNTNGGTLIVGVSDNGTPVGINADRFHSEDKMNLHLVNLVTNRMGPVAMTAVHPHFEDYDGYRVLTVRCERSRAPVYVKDERAERFYVRNGPSTVELPASEIVKYVQQRFPVA